jgi:hypothetical protein
MAVPVHLVPLLFLAAAASAPRPLDRARVHGLYQDGEFERVLRELEAYGKGRCACPRADRSISPWSWPPIRPRASWAGTICTACSISNPAPT